MGVWDVVQGSVNTLGLLADTDADPNWFLRVYAILTTLAAGGAGAYAWWRSQQKELTAEEVNRRKLVKEEQERDLAQRSLPLTVVLAELKEDHRKIAEGMARKTEELTELKVRAATLETRLASTEQRMAASDTRCTTLERENIEIRREHAACKEAQTRQEQQIQRQEQELQELRRRADVHQQSQGGGT